MELERQDLRRMHRLLQDKLTMGLQYVLIKGFGTIDLNSLDFAGDEEDLRITLAGIPNSRDFQIHGIRNVYELLIGVDKGRIPARDVVHDGVRYPGEIDLQGMLEEKQRLDSLDWEVKHIIQHKNRGVELSSSPFVQKNIGKMNAELQALCRDEYGYAMAKWWWEQSGKAVGLDPPVMGSRESGINPTKDRWHQDHHFTAGYPRRVFETSEGFQKEKIMDIERVKATEDQMKRLGSLVDFSKEPFPFGEGSWRFDEVQLCGPLGKRDQLHISWDLTDAQLLAYNLVLRKYLEIPTGKMAGIDLPDLEWRLGKVDWRVLENEVYSDPFQYKMQRERLFRVMDEMMKLENFSGASREVYDRLALKHIAYTKGAAYYNLEEQVARYEQKLRVRADDFGLIGIMRGYNLLDNRSVARYESNISQDRWNWYRLHPTKRLPDGGRVLEKIEGSHRFNLKMELARMGQKRLEYDMLTGLRDGAKLIVPLSLGGVTAERVVFADPAGKQVVIDKEETKHYELYKVSDQALYRERIALAEKYRPALSERLQLLGLNNRAIEGIFESLLLRDRTPGEELVKSFNQDKGKFTVEVGKNLDGSFSIHAIGAALRKGPRDLLLVIDGVDIGALDRKMAAINWAEDFYGVSNLFHRTHPSGNREMLRQAEEVQEQLLTLSKSPNLEGLHAAAALALKYLKDTPNERTDEDLWHIVRGKEFVVDFPAVPLFSLKALYNLMDDRFALGTRMGFGDQPQPPEKNWFRLDGEKLLLEHKPPITLVPGGFSVEGYVNRLDGILELQMPTVLKKAVQDLEEGSLVAFHADPHKSPMALFVYADPVSKCLQVDLPYSLQEAGYRNTKFNPLQKSIKLHDMLGILREVPAMNERIDRMISYKKDSDRGPDGDENERKQGRKR